MFHLAELVGHLLIIVVEVVAEGKHDVDLVGSGFDRKSYLGHLDFDERLGRGEASGYGRDVDRAYVEHGAHDRHEVGVDAYGGYVGQLGVFLLKGVDTLGEVSYRLL